MDDLDHDEDYIETKETVSSKAKEQEIGSQGPVKKKPRPAPTPRHQWTPNEKSALKRQFRTNVINGKTLCQLDCLNAMKREK